MLVPLRLPPAPWCENRALMSPNLSWTLSRGVLRVAALVLVVYVRRWRAVRLGSPRGAAEAPVWRLGCFAASVLIGVVALVSPIDALAGQLFFAPMFQHMLLLDLAPVLGIPVFSNVALRPVTPRCYD